MAEEHAHTAAPCDPAPTCMLSPVRLWMQYATSSPIPVPASPAAQSCSWVVQGTGLFICAAHMFGAMVCVMGVDVPPAS